MNLTEFFIRRPVTTSLLTFALILFGVIGYIALPVSDVPNVDYPTISVSASLPGASPETMASSVATPLEKQFTIINGLTSMSSKSVQGSTQVTLQFDLNRNLDSAAMDVQAAISRAGGDLPTNLPAPPSYTKVNPSDQPIIYIAMFSKAMPLYRLSGYAKTFLAQRLSMVTGVAQVIIYGEKKFSVRAKVNPDVLASKRIGIDEVADSLKRGNVNLPTGNFDGQYKTSTINTDGQLFEAESYRSLIVTYRDGRPVHLEELGEVADSASNEKVEARYNDQPSIVIAIKRQPGTNTIEVVDSIEKILPVIKEQLPASVVMETIYDRSQSIRESVKDVKVTLAIAVGLVIAVIFVFLKNLRATVITSVAVPSSLIATCAVMYKLNFSIDNISLMAMTLSVGFVVDDAVVMIENIFRHKEMGKSPFQAAVDGAREVGFTIVSMTLSLVVVFLPVMFMSGMLGRILNEFSMTIAVTILLSGVVSLTLTPMLCSRFLKGDLKHEEGGHKKGFFSPFYAFYERSLHWVIKHRFLTLIGSFVLLLLTVGVFMIMRTGFIPSEDMNFLFGMTLAEQGVSSKAMNERQHALTPLILNDPNVSAIVNVPMALSSNSGFVFLRLKERSERKMNADQVMYSLGPKLWIQPSMMVFLQNPPAINVSTKWGMATYMFTLQSPLTSELFDVARKFEMAMRELPMLQDVSSDLMINNPELKVRIDRDKASSLGLTAQQIENAMTYAYSGGKVSTIYATNDQYDVILELGYDFQGDPTLLSKLYVKSDRGNLVPLDAAVKTEMGEGPLSINHTGQLPSVTMFFNLKPGVALGDATKAIKTLADKTIPAGISTNFEGSASAFGESLRSMYWLMVFAVLVIYIILGVLYESFIHPLTILSGLPSAAFGGLLTLLVFGAELNLYGMVGIIMLIGIVKKNAIMVVDFAIEAEKKEGKSPEEAVIQGCLVRLRPIMMTTIAAVMGAMPIALGMGAGAESRRTLGLVVVGGLILSQVVTLYLTPVFYIYMDRLQARFTRNKAPAASAQKKAYN